MSAPAHNAMVGNLGGMMVLAAGGIGLATAIGDSIAAARDARYARRYHDALGAATAHADAMEGLARGAMAIVADLEAEVASLRAACCQRQEYINRLKGRRQ